MAYATLEQLLDYMNKKTPTPDEEVALLGYLDAATENIDRALNRWRAGCEHFADSITLLEADPVKLAAQLHTRADRVRSWQAELRCMASVTDAVDLKSNCRCKER